MTAAVPDPFRDQLADALRDVSFLGPLDRARVFDALLPLIAAHVEAERQAALLAAAEDLEYIADKTAYAGVALGYEWAAGRVREIAEGATT